MNIKIDIHDNVSAGFVDLKKAKGVICRNTLNQIAFLVRKNDIKNIQDDFTLRNKFTTSSVRVEKAVGKNINNMQSITGILSRADYLELHDKGGIKKPKRGNRLAIPQLASRGGVKKRLVSRDLYLKNIKRKTLKWSGRHGSKRARTVAMAYTAQKTGMFLNYSKNIYRITSFNKINNKIRFKKQHLYNLTENRARIKRTPHFEPALKKPIRDAQNIFNSQMRKLLRKDYII